MAVGLCYNAMQRYQSSNTNTGITAYQVVSGGITVQFKDGSVYLYTSRSAGRKHIDQMKKLAAQGEGLTTYINRFVRENYAAKLQ